MAKGRFIKKIVPKTTNNITKGIINQIKKDGWSASRINTTGIWDEKRGCFRRSGARKGVLDISACINGIYVVIDTKNDDTGDSISTEQTNFINEVIAAGGIAFVAENIDHFNDWYFHTLPLIIKQRICQTYHAIIK